MAESAEGSGEAGYRAIELGPYGYLPADVGTVSDELTKTDCLSWLVTIFDNLLDEENYENVPQADGRDMLTDNETAGASEV